MMSESSTLSMFRAIGYTLRARGLWPALSLSNLLLRKFIREWFGRHHRRLINFVMAGTAAYAGYALYEILTGSFIPSGKAEWMLIPLALVASVSALTVGVGHFILPQTLRRQLWLRAAMALFVAPFFCLAGYYAFDHWASLFAKDPAATTLMGLVIAAITYGMRDVIAWFLRCVMIRDMGVIDMTDLASLTDEGRKHVSIHEAGHALCYGLTEAVPVDAYAYVDSDNFSLISGAVSIPIPRDPTEVTRPLMEWHMLMTMAGIAAEEVIIGTSTMIGSGDIEAFTKLAGTYLVAGHGECYDMNAKSEGEIAANRAAIVRLRDHYAEKARQFIATNRSLCEALAIEINAVEFLDSERIAKFVHRVQLPEGWQLITWAKSVETIPFDTAPVEA